MRKWRKLDFCDNENGCFIVTSHRLNGEGYAYMYYEGGEQRAHRVVYQNVRDRLARGRTAIGERNGSSKITEEMAREIKIMNRDGIKPRDIMNRLNVSVKT